MTHERDIDRLLDLWMLDGPTEVADRVVIDAAARIDRVPQRPSWRLRWRPTPMLRSASWAAAALVLLIVAVAGFAVFGGSLTRVVGGPPTPTPTALAPSSGGLAPVIGAYVGAPRDLPGVAPSDNDRAYLSIVEEVSGTYLNFQSGDTSISGSGAVLLSNPVTIGTGEGTFTVQAVDRTLGCEPGAEGTYGWSFADGPTALVLTAVDDPCQGRRAALTGEWTGTDCDGNLFWLCLGRLDAGTYRTAMFQPLPAAVPDPADPDGYVAADYGQLTYTVPEGWSNPLDSPERAALVRGEQRGLDLVARAAADVEAACPGAGSPADGSASALAEWLAGHPGVSADPPTDIVIDGHAGQMVDLRHAPGPTLDCPGLSGRPGAVATDLPLLVDPGAPDLVSVGLRSDEAWRVIALDLGDGQTTAIVIRSPGDPAIFDAFVAEAMPVVESFDYR